MRINDILTESQQQELEEGPLLNKIGSAVGKGVGALAKGVGAVAGGVAGLGSALKTGYQSGKATVAGAGAPAPAPAGNLTGAAKTAADKTAPAPAGNLTGAAKTAAETMYAQVKANIDKLDKKGKQRILQLLQTSLATPAAGTTPAATPPAAGTTPAATPPAAGTTPAATPPAAGTTPAATATGDQPQVRNRKVARKRAAAPNQASIDADRDRLMGKFTDSIVRQKQRMVSEGLLDGSISIFKK